MSLKNSNTTADYIDWNEAINLVNRLYRDKNYRMSLLIGCGIFFGLRISDLRLLKWSQILSSDDFEIIEHKTGKRRRIKINRNFQKHIKDCYEMLSIQDPDERCFISAKNSIYSIQRINVLLKGIKAEYGIKSAKHISSHSLRKTFGRHIFDMASVNGQGEMALVMLSELFNHSSITITKRYLGLRQEEILHCYDLLDF